MERVLRLTASNKTNIPFTSQNPPHITALMLSMLHNVYKDYKLAILSCL